MCHEELFHKGMLLLAFPSIQTIKFATNFVGFFQIGHQKCAVEDINRRLTEEMDKVFDPNCF